MKGLLLKDLLLIKNQKRSILVSAVMVIFFTFLNKNRASAFGVMFLSLILITYALGSINYDDDSNGNSFLNTLPFSRREYVQEKYLLSILSSLAAGVISSLLLWVQALFSKARDPELWATVLTCFLMCLIMASIGIPLRIRFGGEQGRLVNSVVLVVLYAAMLVAFGVVKDSSANILKVSLYSFFSNTISIIIAVVIFTILIMIVSYIISVRVNERKDF